MDLALRARSSAGPATALVAIGAAGGAFALLTARSSYDVWGGALVAPVVFAIAWPLLARAATREGDHRLLWFWLGALLVKFGASVVRLLVITDVYATGDALAYHHAGRALAPSLRGLDPAAFATAAGTEVVEVLTGMIYAITGPSILAGFIVFATLAFAGQFLWFRAFRIAFPARSPWPYAVGVFLLPSLVFWPSSIGKESWMIAALGLCAVGAARLLTGSLGRGAALLGLGCAGAALVRPHFAALIAAAVTFAWATRRARAGSPAAPVARAFVAGALLIVTMVLVGRTTTYFDEQRVGEGTVTTILEDTQERSSRGGSAFESRVVRGPLDVPPALALVLFRPLPTEAANVGMALAAAESMLLALGVLVWRRRLWRAVRRMRRSPYITFALVYVLLFCAAFSTIGNFGILVRQRTLMLPALLVLFLGGEVSDGEHARAASG